MLKFSKKTEYALAALQYISRAEKDRVITVKEMAESLELSQALLAKICQTLVKNDLIKSVQGARGGYELNAPADQITLFQVIEAIEGPFGIVDCQADAHNCNRSELCTLRPSFKPIQEHLAHYFKSMTLAKMQVNIQGVNYE